MQQSLYDNALQLRKDHSTAITTEADFRDFFTSADENVIHGGFAHCHFADEDVLQPLLKELKVTVRCIPRDDNKQGEPVFTAASRPRKKRSLRKRISRGTATFVQTRCGNTR